MSEKSDGDSFKYWAFLSYSHRDNAPAGNLWANWVHERLETFVVPTGLTASTGEGALPTRLFPVFQDEKEFPTRPDLGEAIHDALRQSRYLIVICSPNAARSRYVDEEIRFFKSLGRERNIQALIVAGEPNASETEKAGRTDPVLECFPNALRYHLDDAGAVDPTRRTEPIAADVRLADAGEATLRQRGKRWHCAEPGHDAVLERESLRLIAGALGVGFDELIQRDKERALMQARARARRLRALVAGFAVLALAAIVAAVVAVGQKRTADRQTLAAQAEGWHSRLELARNLYERAFVLRDAQRPQAAAAALLRALAIAPPAEAPAHYPRRWDAAHWPEEAWRFLTVLDGQMPRPEFVLRGHREPVFALRSAYLANGEQWLVSAGRDGTVHTWNPVEGRERQTLSFPKEVENLVLGPDGSEAVVRLKGETAHLWNVFTGQAGPEVPYNDNLVFSPDHRLVAGGDDEGLYVWDKETGKTLWHLDTEKLHSQINRQRQQEAKDSFSLYRNDGPNFGEVSAIAFDLLGNRVAFVSGEYLLLVNTGTFEVINQWTLTDGNTRHLVFSPLENEPDILYIAGIDRNVFAFDLTNGVMKAKWHTEAQFLMDFSFDSGGTAAILTGSDGAVQFFDLATGAELPRLEGFGLVHAEFDTKLGKLYASDLHGAVYVFDFSGTRRSGYALPNSKFNTALLTADGGQAVLSSNDQTVRWDVAGQKEIARAFGPLTLNHAQFSPDGRLALHMTWDGHIQLWEPATGRAVRDLEIGGAQVAEARWIADGRRVLAVTRYNAYADGRGLHFLDAATGRSIFRGTVDKHGRYALDPGGNLLLIQRRAASGGDAPLEVALIDLATGQPLAQWPGEATALAFSADSHRAAVGWSDKSLTVHNTAAGGARVARIGELATPAQSLDFSPDGRFIVADGSWNYEAQRKQLEAWELPPADGSREPVRRAAVPLAGNESMRFVFAGADKLLVETYARTGNRVPCVQVCDLAAGTQLMTLNAELAPDALHHEQGSRAVVSPDGRLAAGPRGKDVLIWETAHWQPVALLPGTDNAKQPVSLAFSADSTRLATLDGAGVARLWRAADGAYERAIDPGEKRVEKVRFVGTALALSRGPEARLWNPDSGQPLGTMMEARSSSIGTTADLNAAARYPTRLTPDTRYALSGGTDDDLFRQDGKDRFAVVLQDVASGRLAFGRSGGFETVTSGDLSPDGRTALVGHTGFTELVEVATSRVLRTFGERLLAPEQREVATRDGATEWSVEYDPASKTEDDLHRRFIGERRAGRADLERWPDALTGLNCLALSPDESLLLTANQTVVRLWDIAGRKAVRELPGNQYRVNSVAYSGDGKLALSGCDDGSVRLWDLATGRQLQTLLANDARLPVWEQDGDEEKSWQRKTRPAAEPLNPSELVRVIHVAFAANGRWAVAVTAPIQPSKDHGTWMRELSLRVWRLFDDDTPTAPAPAGGRWSLASLAEVARLRVLADGPRRNEIDLLDEASRIPVPGAPQADAAGSPAGSPAGSATASATPKPSPAAEPLPSPPPPPPAVPGAVFVAHAELLATGNSPDAALAAIDEALRRSPRDGALLVKKADLHERRKEYPQARTALEAALALTPGDPELHKKRASLTWDMKDFDACFAAMAEAIRLAPDKTEYLTTRGYYFAQRDRGEEARRDFEAALGRKPSDAGVRQGYGWALFDLRDAAGALDQWRQAADSVSKPSADLLCGMAIGRWATGDHAGAVDSYKQLVLSVPDWLSRAKIVALSWPAIEKEPLLSVRAEALGQRSVFDKLRDDERVNTEQLLAAFVGDLWEADRREQALEYFTLLRNNRAVIAEPEYVRNLPLDEPARARLLEAQAAAEKCREIYLLKRLPYVFALTLGRCESARQEAERTVAASPRDGTARMNLGWLLFNLGDLPGAAAQWKEAETLRPEKSTQLLAALMIEARQRGDLVRLGELVDQSIEENPAWLYVDKIREAAWTEIERNAVMDAYMAVMNVRSRHHGKTPGYTVVLLPPWTDHTKDAASDDMLKNFTPSLAKYAADPAKHGWDLVMSNYETKGGGYYCFFYVERVGKAVDAASVFAQFKEEDAGYRNVGEKFESREVNAAGRAWQELTVTGGQIQFFHRLLSASGGSFHLLAVVVSSNPQSALPGMVGEAFRAFEFDPPTTPPRKP